MTYVHAAGGRVRRAMIVAMLAAGMLGASAVVATEEASAHGSCLVTARAPHLSPSGAQIRAWSTIDCDFQHEVVQTCVALEKNTPGGWETFGQAPHKCNDKANSRGARANVGRPCISGLYRTRADGHAIGANGHRHDTNPVFSDTVTVTCGTTAVANTNLDDVLFTTSDLLTVSG